MDDRQTFIDLCKQRNFVPSEEQIAIALRIKNSMQELVLLTAKNRLRNE